MFLICGEALFDVLQNDVHSVGHPGQPIGLTAMPGGSPFNVAIGLARLSRRVAMLTGIADDGWGEQLEAVLDAEHVDTHHLVKINQAVTALAMIRLDRQGVPQYDFRCFRSADSLLEREHLPTLTNDIRAIHVGSFSLVTHPTSDSLEALVARALPDRLITLDPNVRLSVEPSREHWKARLEVFRRFAHIIKISEEDIQLLYGTSPEELAAEWLSSLNCEVIIITRGSRGADAYTRRHGRVHVAAPTIDMVDTVGAGDAFQAAMLCWLDEHDFLAPTRLPMLTSDDLVSMLSFATTASAITCERQGPDFPQRCGACSKFSFSSSVNPRTLRAECCLGERMT